MNDIQVGEYVRFKRDSIISKIPNEDMLLTYKKWEEDGIIKHSFNIADLIEVGDYVNGYKVSEINNRRIGLECSERSWSYFYWEDNNFNIDTILTKEQFEKYKFEV